MWWRRERIPFHLRLASFHLRPPVHAKRFPGGHGDSGVLRRGRGLRAAEGAGAAGGLGVRVLATGVLLAGPLLFASLEEAVAAAGGVPVRALGIGFLALVGLTAAETTQAVGALLLLGLLAAPAAAAHRLTTHPFRGLALATALAIGAMWVGLATSYAVPSVPPSFAIIATAVVMYAGASALHGAARRGFFAGGPNGESLAIPEGIHG